MFVLDKAGKTPRAVLILRKLIIECINGIADRLAKQIATYCNIAGFSPVLRHVVRIAAEFGKGFAQ